MWNVQACVLSGDLYSSWEKACPHLATVWTASSSYEDHIHVCFLFCLYVHTKQIKVLKEVCRVSDHWDVLHRNPKASAGAEWSHMAASWDRSNQLVSPCVCVCVCVCVRSDPPPARVFHIKDEWALFSEGPLPESRLVFLMTPLSDTNRVSVKAPLARCWRVNLFAWLLSACRWDFQQEVSLLIRWREWIRFVCSRQLNI